MMGLQSRVTTIHKWIPPITQALGTIPSARSMSSRDTKWLWEAGDDIKEYHKANMCGTRIGSFLATINSSKPLKEEDVLKTLKPLMKKIPNLRTCLQTRDDNLWFCQPPNLKPNFKMLKMDTEPRDALLSAIENMLEIPGTVQWSFRIYPHSEDVECLNPVVKKSHPHQYGLVFTGHHGIMDGIGASFIMKIFIDILSDVLEGNTVDDDEYAPFCEEREIPALIRQIKEKLAEDSTLVEAVQSNIPSPSSTPLFFQAFPRPQVKEVTTRCVSGMIEPRVFDKLLSKSKEEGVTLNSAFLSAINVAVMELVRERGVLMENYEIASVVTTTLRRYKQPSSTFFFGPCTGHMSYMSTVDDSVKSRFWKYCKTVDTELHTRFQKGVPLQEKALQSMLDSSQEPHDYITRIKPPLHDYTINNMGDLSRFVSEDEKVVKITSLSSHNMIHNTFHTTFHEILSVKGRNYYTLSYGTNYVSEDTAKLFLDRIFSVLREVIQLP
ncbi:uncharacterized protein [Palaemon carinicauda]|uniref:uncharacterized protein n=1 Tax=Palaemon carinicauda TaxID=392227 RepID=UPI0035B68B8C